VGSYAAHATLHGMPDAGLVTLTEMVDYCRRIANSVNIPVIADAEGGFGGAAKVWRTVREFERAGIAAIHIEDQEWGKHMRGVKPKLLPTEEMCLKIKAAVEAKSDPDFTIIARTDAIWAYNSIDEGIARGKAYAEAGADLVFLVALQSADIPKAARAISVPLFNINTFVPVSEEERNGLKVIIFFSASFFIEYRALSELMQTIKNTGTLESYEERLPSPDEFDEFLGISDVEDLYSRYQQS